jgi:hypothetical protein
MLTNERAIVEGCINTLSELHVFDCTNEEAKEIAKKAFDLINKYPGLQQFRRSVLKVYTIKHYIYRVETHLKGILISGQACPENLVQINQDLNAALALIEDQLNSRF